jgi:hypothetical protein
VKTGALALVWVAALAIVAAAVMAVDRHGTRAALAQADIVVLGSSLLHHALPPTEAAASLLGDARRHQRIGVSGISEEELLQLTGLALQGRASLLLLEANALLRDADAADTSCLRLGWLDALRAFIGQKQVELARSVRIAIGWVPVGHPAGETAGLDTRRAITPEQVARNYPMRLRAPRCRSELDRLVDAARRQGKQLMLVLPPRSFTAQAAMGAAQAAELENGAARLAAELGMPLFHPARAWPDDAFVDYAHMNRTGRERFVRELRQWLQRRA